MDILFNDVHPLNEFHPIKESVSGIVIDFNDEHPLKANARIEVTPYGKMIETRFVQSLKASSSISRTSLGIMATPSLLISPFHSISSILKVKLKYRRVNLTIFLFPSILRCYFEIGFYLLYLLFRLSLPFFADFFYI